MLRVAACLLLGLPSLVPADPRVSSQEPVQLRLDGQLSGPVVGAPDPATGTLLEFGRSDLRRRLDQSRRSIQLLKLENSRVEREIAINESLIQRLQQLSDSRGQTAAVTQEIIRERNRPAAASAAPAVSAVSLQRVKIVHLAPGALAMDNGLIPGLEDWILIAVLGAIILVLLVWVLRLLAHNRAASAAGAGLQAVAAPVQERQIAAVRKAQPRAESTARQSPASGPTPVKPVNAQPAGAARPADAPHKKAATGQPLSDELKEIDTLIAFEQFNSAREKLQVLLDEEPKNPEYLLRHYHLCSVGDIENDEEDEALLRAIMDGPLSDTLLRVKAMGRSMMPGDPLFHDDASRDEARRVMDAARQSGAEKATDSQTRFNSTMIMTPQAGKNTTD